MTWPPEIHQDIKDAVAELRNRSFNVKHYGAVGDGTADDTAAIQAAIDAASGGPAGPEPSPGRDALGPVYLPTGIYKTTAAPLLKAIKNLRMFGDGPRNSQILVSGSRTDGVTVIGCPILRLENFGIIGEGGYGGTTDVTYGIALDWTPTQTDTYGATNLLNNVYVEDLRFAHGMAFGARSANYDLSGVHGYDCYVGGNRPMDSDDSSGLWQTGYLSGNGTHGNVLNHHFIKCEGGFLRRLHHVNAVNTVTIENPDASFIDTVLYRAGTGNTVLRDARIEDSRRLAVCAPIGGYPVNLTIENILWAPGSSAPADGKIIQWKGTGNVLLRQLYLWATSSDADWLFEFDNSGVSTWQTNVLVHGIAGPNGTAQSLFSIPTGSKVYAEVHGLVQEQYAGLTGTYVGRKVLVYNGASGDSGTSAITT